MEISTFEIIKEAAIELEAKGEKFDNNELIEWLKVLEKEDPEQRENRIKSNEANLTRYLAKHETRLESYRARIEINKAGFDSMISAAVSTLKSSILINGGACIAILALIGHKSENSSLTIESELKDSLAIFALGVFASAAASAAMYFAQYYYARENEITGNKYRWVGIILVALSYFGFCFGAYIAYSGM